MELTSEYLWTVVYSVLVVVKSGTMQLFVWFVLLGSDIYINTLNHVAMGVPLHFVTNARSSSHRGTCICLEQTIWRWIISHRICAVCEKMIRRVIYSAIVVHKHFMTYYTKDQM